MQFLKRQVPVIIAFATGLVFWTQYYIPSSFSQNALKNFNAWAIIIAGFALVLGILSAIHHHWTKISLRKPGFGFSLVTLFCFGFVVLGGWFTFDRTNWVLVMTSVLLAAGVLVGIIGLLRRTKEGVLDIGLLYASGLLTTLGVVGFAVILPLQRHVFGVHTINEGSLFEWIFQNMFVPLDATMFSLLAFYIASAAFRAFRARSFEATALLIAGVVVMVGRVYLGEVLAWPGTDVSVTSVAGWILNNPNAAAFRGILLGVILSQVAISLRIIFGIERTYMGGGD